MDAHAMVEGPKLFHPIEKKLFSRLVNDLKQDIPVAWQVMSLWMWLEEAGFPDIIMKLFTLSNAVVHYVTSEAMVCLDCIKTGRIPAPPVDDIPFMNLLTKKGISLQFFYDNRREAIEGLLRITKKLQSRGFEDNEWRPIFANAAQSAVAPVRIRPTTSVETHPAVPQRRMRPIVGSGATGYGGTTMELRSRIISPFGEGSCRGSDIYSREGVNKVMSDTRKIQIRPLFGEGSSRVGDARERQTWKQQGRPSSVSRSNSSDLARPWEVRVAEEDRALFMTFSRGYPVSEREVRNFITTLHGDCIESIYMQEVIPPNLQSLFALVIFKTASTIERILDGKVRVNFVINGKHARVRRWEPK